MPYIPKIQRYKYNALILELSDLLKAEFHPGTINYVISSILWDLFQYNVSYSRGNEIIGCLECIKLEFYRRQLAILEDRKIEENGDIL